MNTVTPGYKTSEFYTTAIGSLLLLLNQSGLIDQPISSQNVLTIAGLLLGYLVHRGILKNAVVNATTALPVVTVGTPTTTTVITQ